MSKQRDIEEDIRMYGGIKAVKRYLETGEMPEQGNGEDHDSHHDSESDDDVEDERNLNRLELERTAEEIRQSQWDHQHDDSSDDDDISVFSDLSEYDYRDEGIATARTGAIDSNSWIDGQTPKIAGKWPALSDARRRARRNEQHEKNKAETMKRKLRLFNVVAEAGFGKPFLEFCDSQDQVNRLLPVALYCVLYKESSRKIAAKHGNMNGKRQVWLDSVGIHTGSPFPKVAVKLLMFLVEWSKLYPMEIQEIVKSSQVFGEARLMDVFGTSSAQVSRLFRKTGHSASLK